MTDFLQGREKLYDVNFSIGFAHGVLNTDNMSLASVTIDYGPFGFVDSYDPNFTPNHSDDDGKWRRFWSVLFYLADPDNLDTKPLEYTIELSISKWEID